MKLCTICNEEYPLSYFFKNKNMADGHLNFCKACSKKRNAPYKDATKKVRYAQTKEWKLKNKEAVAEYRSKYWKENSEKEKLSNKAWREANKDRHKLLKTSNNAKRRASKRNATPWWSDISAIREIYRAARELTMLTGIQFHVDHIVPLVNDLVQGLHVPANLRIVPYYENVAKSNKLIEDIVLS